MNRKFLLFVSLVFCGSMLFSQVIPNAGFETWVADGSFENPESWSTSNVTVAMMATIETTSKDEDAQEGTYSARLESISPMGFSSVAPGLATLGQFNLDIAAQSGDVTGGIEWTTRPANFKGYYKYMPQGDDQAFIGVVFYKYNQTTGVTDSIGEALINPNTTVDTWTEFDLPIEWTSNETPDSMNIIVMSSDGRFTPVEGSVLFIDNFSFEGTAPTTIENKEISENITIYPNPTKNSINLTGLSYKSNVNIYDLTGKLLIKETSNISNKTINVSNLASGIYIVEIETSKGKQTKQLIIE